jgi:hypothetical protein
LGLWDFTSRQIWGLYILEEWIPCRFAECLNKIFIFSHPKPKKTPYTSNILNRILVIGPPTTIPLCCPMTLHLDSNRYSEPVAASK